MNTTSTPLEYPTWHDGVIYDPPTRKTKPEQPEQPQPAAAATVELHSAPHSRDPEAAPPLFKQPPERHTRKCAICNHPDRREIEEAYLAWVSPNLIVNEHSLPSFSSLYRHVEATGLPILRRRRIRAALDPVIEQACSVRVTGADVIRAIIASSRIGDEGEYIEPVKRSEITHRHVENQPFSNRETILLETPQPQQNKAKINF
jgi:hypothetical protein